MRSDRLRQLQEVAGPVSRETYDCLLAFSDEFNRWSQKINLAAPSTLPGLWERHILDSAQLLPLAPEARFWLDLGSGGGFPGAVIALLLRERPGARIALVESNKKKAAFLRSTLGRLGALAEVHASRIEATELPVPEVVTARALAPLPQLLELSSPWLSGGARGLFHKGREYRDEIQESRDLWAFDLVEHQSAVAADSVILQITRLQKR